MNNSLNNKGKTIKTPCSKCHGSGKTGTAKHVEVKVPAGIDDDQSMRLQKGIAAADSKGVNDSLVLVDDIAFIVNVPSKTVVTAMDQAETNSNVFTNIDGAVIM